MRKPLALMLAGLMAVSMVGCGSNGDAASSNNKDKADSGKVTLKVTTTYAGEDTNAGNYKDACAAWTKETGNKIEDSSATSDETFKSKVIVDFEQVQNRMYYSSSTELIQTSSLNRVR